MSRSYYPNESELEAITQRAQRHVANLFKEGQEPAAFTMDPAFWLWADGYIAELEGTVKALEERIEEYQVKADELNYAMAAQERQMDRLVRDAENADADRQDLVRILEKAEAQ